MVSKASGALLSCLWQCWNVADDAMTAGEEQEQDRGPQQEHHAQLANNFDSSADEFIRMRKCCQAEIWNGVLSSGLAQLLTFTPTEQKDETPPPFK